MFTPINRIKHSLKFALVIFVTIAAANSYADAAGLATISGVVKDDSGNPIADASVAVFRSGTSILLKQVFSKSDGSFLTKILPGKYTILAVAEGFNPVTYSSVDILEKTKLKYGIKLERAGSGKTLPERRGDRANSKWRIRSSQLSRSIFQNSESKEPIEILDNDAEVAKDLPGKSETVIETFAATGKGKPFGGVNIARQQAVTGRTNVSFVGQLASERSAPQRLAAGVDTKLNANHKIRASVEFLSLGDVKLDQKEENLGQFSAQISDEWRVREGVILVVGVDFARLFGAGNDSVVSPRIGVQFDANSKTRIRSSVTSQTLPQTWETAIEGETSSVYFREPVSVLDVAVVDNKPKAARNTRFEFGVERILSNRETLETGVFVDLAQNRGVGFAKLPINSLSEDIANITGNQSGTAYGARVVYNRRLSGIFSTSAGFAFGSGQKLSAKGLQNVANLFENGNFSTLFGQLDADLSTGTKVRTIFRLSSDATVFAIDPFQGRLAIYDPSLSILIKHPLPNLGLPFRAQAIVDARNIFDFQTGIAGDEGVLKLNTQRMMLRGGILVRF